MNAEQQNLLRTLESIFATKEDLRRIEDKAVQFKDEVLTSNDKLAKKLDTILTEQAAFLGGQRRQDETLGNHEHRLLALEV